ncbi:heterokaryon incompatibility protein-domain-containing protein [Lophiotrema nucula]|uniref:Heterokaryon incompatibility protein-domain-containing protein n=1 Tax=Lophiotrema nucula TaxID=690887 RepID=A0A6A5YU54_9PLEO|nr:heterokaryon incompatibility protein-domain-containing protein [Lophiotrema nucula]
MSSLESIHPGGTAVAALEPIDLESLPEYHFEPLGGDTIRILTIHETSVGLSSAPGQNSLQDEIIECSLEQIDYRNGGYHALSYVWGSEDRPYRAVVVGDAKEHNIQGYIGLTETLWNALRDLRDAKSIERKVFWVDQLCIDQKKLDEKSRQVMLMREIYSCADQVIVYLGCALRDQQKEAQGIWLLRQIHDHFAPNHKYLEDGETFSLSKTSGLPVQDLPHDLSDVPEDDDCWNFLIEVAFGEWTQRLWILQEQLLNREVTMLRGPESLSWDSVVTLSFWFKMDLLPQEPVSSLFRTGLVFDKERSPWSISYSLWYRWLERRLWQERPTHRSAHPPSVFQIQPSSQTRRPLVANLAAYQDLACTDPRDRIYALLGISSDATELNIKPDYSASVENVFRQASTAILRNSPDLIFLAYACRWGTSAVLSALLDSSLCSWSYNFVRPYEKEATILPFGTSTPHPLQKLTGPPRFESSHGRILVSKGRIIDGFSYTTPPTFYGLSFLFGSIDEDSARTLSLLLKNWSDLLLYAGITVRSAAALLGCLVADPSWSPPPSAFALVPSNISAEPRDEEQQRQLELLYAFYFVCLFHLLLDMLREIAKAIEKDHLKTVAPYEDFLEKLHAAFGETHPFDFSHPREVQSLEDLDRARSVWEVAYCRGRSFCVTKEGRLCSGMNNIETSDVVAALQGGDRLFVLRPVPGQTFYRLVGDAYVDGLMQGEAYEGLDPKEVDYDIRIL